MNNRCRSCAAPPGHFLTLLPLNSAGTWEKRMVKGASARMCLRIFVILAALSVACIGACSAEARTDPNQLLTEAVEKNDLKAVQEALTQGAVPDKTNGDPPVSFLAARRGQTAILKALLDHGANPHFRTKIDGASLLIYGVHTANPATVRLLLDRKVNVNLRNKLGETALNSVGETEAPQPPGRVVVMRMLLKAGADPEIRDREGRTALMRYADYGITTAVDVLADAGANVNARDQEGNTALILAAGWLQGDVGIPRPAAYIAILKRLLKQGAHPKAQNHDGATALTAAVQSDHPALASLLQEHVPEYGIPATQGRAGARTLAPNLLLEARQTATAIRAPDAAILALTQIAERQAQFGDKTGARQTIRMAKQTMEKVADKSTQTFSLAHLTMIEASVGDTSAARRMVTDLPDGAYRENVYCKDLVRHAIAVAQAKAGDVSSAQRTAYSIQNHRFQNMALLSIAEAQEQEGDGEGARETLRTAQKTGEKFANNGDESIVWSLLSVAQAQTKAGDPTGAQETIRFALRNAQQAAEVDLKNRVLHDIAEKQAQMHTVADATQTANRIHDPDCKAWTLTRIAAAQVQVGATAGARRTLTNALQTATAIPDVAYRGAALAAIVRGRIQARDLPGAQKTARAIQDSRQRDAALLAVVQARIVTQGLRHAQTTAADIHAADPKSRALAWIARAQRQSGTKTNAERTLQHAAQNAARIDTPNARVTALLVIAQAQAHESAASRRTCRSALQAAQQIPISEDRTSALQEIAETQAALGDKAGAKQTIARIDNARDRVRALLAAAEISGQR